MSNYMKIHRASKACFGQVRRLFDNSHDSTELIELLSELEVDYPDVLAEWWNGAQATVEDVALLLKVEVVKHQCDNCGSTSYRCYPPRDDWDFFQGCRNPHDVGALVEVRGRQDLFICDDCWSHNPAFAML